MVAVAGGGSRSSGVVALAGGGGLLDDYHRTLTPAPQRAQDLRNRGRCFPTYTILNIKNAIRQYGIFLSDEGSLKL